MPEYLVVWSIVLEADSPEEAARTALAVQRDPFSVATTFDVVGEAGAVTINVQMLDDTRDQTD